ncbi:TDP-N-acetylfucosamine:lipid II N-acetylfucosaminyltransferase [Urechidicola vernalis]|uniref:TDP-N-acetylfucosamine:lipid II N-acetylfucosaminyltransferase n=1 Tax=Urechidicola vernalis TaxID=3075600 RepID=A0ABU2Y299_9FLAO|nr:TDP-N-acetylfucosamine:lipid II N-acetylfucosaminyltransferase [Urechidicola sp. P050]MDT0552275.1 TDP-N-acetylfucosamine:lipid II N-acetylfucosaminyltransferase [Urechidicola sp. P050]
MIKAIHIFDDDKFVDYAIKLFEASNTSNFVYKYFVIGNSNTFGYVNSSLAIPLDLSEEKASKNFVQNIHKEKIQVVHIHVLNQRKFEIIELLNPEVLIVWYCWGYDLYQQWFPFKQRIYEKETFKYIHRHEPIKRKVLNKVIQNSVIYNWLRKTDYKNNKRNNWFLKKIYECHPKRYQDCFNKVKIVVPVLETEMTYLHQLNNEFKFSPFAYGTLREFLNKENFEVFNYSLGDNILVGNSANPTNNHVEVFIKLSKINLKNRKVIVPLSYSGSEDYITYVLLKGKELLGANFSPILNFIELEEYNKILLSCRIVFFNHIRQQAMGNIITLGYMGATLFINKKSPVHKFLKDNEFIHYTIDDLNIVLLNAELEENIKKKNRLVLEDLYSFEKVLKKVQSLNRIVKSNLFTA